jgi:hypothetical protein
VRKFRFDLAVVGIVAAGVFVKLATQTRTNVLVAEPAILDDEAGVAERVADAKRRMREERAAVLRAMKEKPFGAAEQAVFDRGYESLHHDPS